jgi:hypothetical protein
MPKIVQVNSFGKQHCWFGIQVSREVTEESGSAGAAETSLRTKSVPLTLEPHLPVPFLKVPYVALSPTTDFQVLRFGETLIAKHQTLRPLSNSDSDVRDYSGGGMKSSASSIVSLSAMGTVQPDQTIHVRLSIWLRILDQPSARRLFDKFGCLSNSFRQKRTIDALHNRANRSR